MRMCPQSEKKQTNKRIRSDATKKQTKKPQKTKEKRGLSLDLWEPTNWDQNARLNQVNAASAGTAWNGARPRPLNAPTKPPIFVFFSAKIDRETKPIHRWKVARLHIFLFIIIHI